MWDVISVVVVLVLLFGAAELLGRVRRFGKFRRAEGRAAANSDREQAEAMRKAQSEIAQGKSFAIFRRN